MLVVNYWDATIGVFSMDGQTGEVTKMTSMHDPNEGRPMKARHDKHVNHSENDENAQRERQADPHSHAVILDPFYGEIAFVPDLGIFHLGLLDVSRLVLDTLSSTRIFQSVMW